MLFRSKLYLELAKIHLDDDHVIYAVGKREPAQGERLEQFGCGHGSSARLKGWVAWRRQVTVSILSRKGEARGRGSNNALGRL